MQADAEIVARDPALPALALVLDAEAVSALLGKAAAPVHLRYKPGVSCMATFRTDDGFVILRALTRERFAEDEMSPRRAALSQFIPDLALIVMPVEADRRITALRKRFDLSGATPLRFKPERRIVLRQGDTMIKAMSKATWDRARLGAAFGASMGGPAVLSVDERHHVIRTEWLAGSSAEHTPEVFHRIGAKLAALHRSHADLPILKPVRPPAALKDLAVLLPDLAPQIRRLWNLLDQSLRDGPSVPCHGDFSADQVMVADDIAFVDWDEAGMGDPARDLGSFLARLDHDGAPGHHAFLQGYGPLPAGVAAHHAAALAALATEGFRNRRPDWPELARRVLDRVEQILTAPDIVEQAADPTIVARLSGQPIRTAAMIRSKPGKRALFRYDTDTAAMVGKLRIKGADLRTPALHTRLRQAGLDGTGDTGVPSLLGRVDPLNLWLQDLVPGSLLTEMIGPEGPCEPFHATGRSLARLHRSGVRAEREWTPEDEAEVLRKAVARMPEASGVVEALIARMLAADREVATIHRDFYPDQVLIDGARVWLLDLDLYANGDPAVDTGNFLAHLDEYAIRHGWNPASLSHQAAAFLAGYATLHAVPANTDLLRAISVARHIGIASTFPDRRHTPPAILAHLQATLS